MIAGTKQFHLSAAQREIWLSQQIHLESPAYNISQFTKIHGAVDPSLFEAALRQVISEAESLRLQFIESSDGLEQWVGSPDWSLPLIDLSAKIDPQTAAEAWMKADYEQPTDLLHGPLFSYALLKIAPDQFLWYQRYHHIVVDGAGRALIARRAAQVYSSRVKGVATNENPFGPVSVLLANDTCYRASDQFTEDQAYWLKHCTDWPEPVMLTDRQAPASHRHLRQTTYLSSQAVQTYASGANRRFAQFMVAAMAAYLHRWTGIQDVVIGLPVMARFGESRLIPGMTSNVLPLRFTVQSDMSLSSLMEKAAQEIQCVLQHQRYRSEELKRGFRLGQSQRLFGPIINLMLFDGGLSFGGHLSTTHNLNNGPVEDLMIAVYTSPDNSSLRIDFDANPALYTADELIAHQRRFLKLLDALVTEPEQLISSIDLLDATERRQLLVEWNATERDYPKHQCVHQLFEKQVARTPEATALVYEEQKLSYAELNARANHLAHQLIELGVQPGEYITTLLKRSIELVTAQLAIFKAGAVYVPIDPQAPAERQIWIMADCAARLLITDTHTKTPDALLTPLLRLTSSSTNKTDTLSAYLNPVRSSLDTAYVMYTSGSTGTPKGVLVPHRAIARLVINNGYSDIGVNDRVAFAANPAFDASTFEIWAPLLNGGSLVVIDHSTVLTPDLFVQTLQEKRVNVMWLTVGLFNQLVEMLAPVFPQLKTLIVGGDALDAKVITKVLRNNPPQQLLNGYGPTESTTFAATYRIASLPEEAVNVPIGRPIANTQLYLLDTRGQPVPLGAVGELYIGGAGVARGYLNRPELTAERFLPDPFSEHENARMYKTGDLARYLPDGNLLFLGRNDHQVKIRGFRIETREVEARLVEHPLVREAAVLVLDKGSNKCLVAYVVAKFGEQIARTLRAHLTAKLPEYMIPAAFVCLDELPLTPNGKLDRRALPVPDDKALAYQVYQAPQGKIETKLAAIWTELLNAEQIGRHDSFFDLGGNSLSAVWLALQIQNIFKVKISVRMLFEAPSIAKFAERLESNTLTLTHSKAYAKTTQQIRSDAVLEQEVIKRTNPCTTPGVWNHVLLTGATGFVGGYLLTELLSQTTAHITCLIKAKNEQEAMQRLLSTLEEISQCGIDQSRLSVICGDLTHDKLGLAETQLTVLADKFDTIIHNGAMVNHFFSYQELRQANVLATKTLIGLAATGREKSFHYISTLSVAPWKGLDIFTEDSEIAIEPIQNGYVQSKWVAERLVSAVAKRGVSCGIYRLGRITADSITGRFNENDRFYRTVRAMATLGIAFDVDSCMKTPVDQAARAIIKLALHQKESHQIAHIMSDQPLEPDEFIAHLRYKGVNIFEKKISQHAWYKEVEHMAIKTSDENLISLLSICDESKMNKATMDKEFVKWCSQKTINKLAALGFEYSNSKEDYAKSTINFLLKTYGASDLIADRLP
ncbi:amino acid adenylation domain-containing protein [Mycoavidus sp. SF9855]|uniref:amino acid adenylation domain-containing protein n=1 Tax=Mycoavidus sp. SF9855 TaxID=2968475 RepID=UPI00211BBFE5|nr:amino acid adenylation domain-containing protein [Mycoavidus sp. SF9855]UUM21174.1 amino acid adenylation domain-containing protein [Mycoavidus sp. SF9855]